VISAWSFLKIVGSASGLSLGLVTLDLKHDGSKCNEHILWCGKIFSFVNLQRLSQICRLFGHTGNLLQNNIQQITV